MGDRLEALEAADPEALSSFPGVEMANVYGVEVPGQDGRAGMVAVRLAAGEAFDGTRFFEFAGRELPSYATPLFVRVLPELEITGTFKLRKVELQKEGFDPEHVADPLWFCDSPSKRYVPLDAAILSQIHAGSIRL